MRVQSKVGLDTTFCLYLPRHHGAAETDAGEKEATRLRRVSRGETVLFIVDEPSVRMLIIDLLTEMGYAAVQATDDVAGLKVLQFDARIDMLVTDVGLPGGMNGLQMADAARAHRPELKVLFITGYAECADIDDGRLGSGMQVLAKPFALDALGMRIKDLVAGTYANSMKAWAEIKGMQLPRASRSKRFTMAAGKRWAFGGLCTIRRDPDAAGQMQRHDLGAAVGILVVDLGELDDPERAVTVPGVDLEPCGAEGPMDSLRSRPPSSLARFSR
ncbi:response regulator [Methylorubrum extorquens]|uniref:Response regulatory domain-containing protein n=2 Tax=Methylorubrum extorquens TaxID=408 RepID=C5B5U1_METEA|nr:response regulator [Methylorubrum extorquens]ACS43823.1 Hypothetical protein MexAM1_META2p1039 [Methylorubrum extorquens AM1]EHP91299.1 response regulator receiver protein [Methylorubrum extorquens DSM 13060]MCP1546332.1 CheY-like chemotaxis protein [Methylorubrum extorquens]MCP1590999.1 CheY-like chemotaxis protein [Methylorubrum extorquens]